MNLNEARARLPDLLDGLDDQSAISVLQQTYYPDMSRQELAGRLGVDLAKPAPTEGRGLLSTAKDVGITAIKAAIGVPEFAVGLADLATGGNAGRALESVGFRPKEAKAILDEQYSDAQKAAFKKVQAADGFVDTAAAALQNPSVIAHSVLESLPSMAAGGVVGRGVAAVAPRLAGVAAGAIGEGVVGAGSAAEQIRQQTPDGLITPTQSGLAALSGAGTTAFGMAGGKVAQKLGIGDIDTALAGGAATQAGQAAQKGLFRRVAEGAVSEGVLEEMPQSIQEQALQNIALGKDAGDGVGQAAALGMLSGGAMGGGFNIRAHAAAPAPSVADIGKAGSVDEAIAAANAAVTAPVGKLSSEDVEAEVARIEAEARQAAQAPAALEAPAVPLADPVAGDILSPKGVPFQTEKMAALKARQGGGNVVPVNGGWVVRPAAAPEAVAQPAQTDTTGLVAMGGGLADGITANLYGQLFDALQAGKSTMAGIKDPVLAKAKPYFDAGLIQSADDLRRFENEGYPTLAAPAAPAAPEAPKPVEAPAAPQPIALEEMPLAALNARMGFIKNQVQANGGWNQMLIDERNRVQAEIDRRATPVAKADGERAPPQWMEKANTTQAQEPGNESAVGNGADSGAGSAGAASGRVAEASSSPAQGAAGGPGAADAAVGSAGSGVSTAGNTTDAQPALTEPAPRTVTVAGEQVTLTPEQATQWDAAQSAHDKAVAVVEQTFQRSKGQATSENPDVGLKSAKERRDAELKRLGMELSAQRRKITDRLTAKERAAAGKSGASLRAGDRITVAGAAGTVKTNAYGRITVQMDGEDAPRRVPREQIVRASDAPAAATDQNAIKAETRASIEGSPTGQASDQEAEVHAPAAEEAEAEPDRDAEPLERDRNGNAERRAPLTGEDRWEYPPVMRGEDPTLTAAKNKVVDYMNGDISRTELMTHLEQSGLPQGIVYSITQRIGEDGPSIGEVDAMLERRERGEPAPGAAPATVRERVMAKLTAKREAAAKPLDHGEINIPGRTNNINAELDRHKARQEAEAKAKRKEDAATLKENKARAKELFAEHGEAIIAQHGEKLGAKDLRKTLDSMVKWEPKKFIALAEKFQKEQAAAREPSAEVEATPAPPKVRKSEVESTAHGMLATAKEKKAFAFKRVKELRQRIKDAPVSEKSALRLDLIKAEDKWREYQRMEASANSKIEEDAAVQGIVFSRATATDTPAFRDWFGDSKVVDEAGKPLVVYHGTAADIQEFTPGRGGKGAREDTKGAIFFTDTPRAADQFAASAQRRAGGSGANVLPVHLAISNPLEVDFAGKEKSETRVAAAIARAKADGNDGVLLQNVRDGFAPNTPTTNVWIAFSPEQVKSAIGNNGEFNAANHDIRFSRAPATDTDAFKRWFGDSKITRNGEPAVLYHSSDATFTAFDKERLGSNTGHASAGLGFFMTPDRETSERYGQHTMPVYVRMENPYRMGVDEFSGFEGTTDAARRRDELRAGGYDGIYVSANQTVIAFEPSQIKSATTNQGTFDLANPDIRFRRPDAAGNDAFREWSAKFKAGGDRAAPPRRRPAGPKAEDLRAQFAPIIAQWKNGPKGGVNVVQSVDDLPQRLAEQLRSAGEDGRAEGFYLPKSDTVYLIADNLPSAARAQEVAFHEVYGHKGMRAVLSDAQYATMMERIRRANPKIAEAAAEWFANYGDDTIAMNMDAGQSEAEAERNARLLSVEEALADMAGTVPVAGSVKQLLATIQRALRAIGLDAVADWMEGKGEAETLKLLADARAAVFGATRKGETHVMAPDAAPAMSRQDAEDGDGYRFATEFLTELAQEDEMFRLPTSDAHTLEGVLADVDPTVEVIGDATREDERDESGADRRTLIRTAGGRDAYIFEKGRDVWLDVSRLDPGMGGDAIYQAVANYALNTRKQFVGDPAGLSPAAIVRRTYHMLGSALRFGTTDHFQPAIEQLEGLPDEGIPPLEWRGNDADKLASLAKVFLETLHHLNPDLSNVRYDFDKQRFFDGETPLERGRLEVLAPGGSGAARAGRRTAAAGVVLASLARATSSERSGLLARALQRPGQLVGGDFGPLFSRQVKEDESTGSEAAGAAQREPAQSVRDRIAEAGRQGRGRADEGDAAPLDGDTPAFSRAALGTNNPREFVKGATDTVSAYLNAPGKVSWWHKTVGTMYNLAKRSPEFRKVYDRVQDFINDVSYYANEAANLAPTIIPKLETIKDLGKSPISAEDNKAIAAPIFEGTLTWARDERGQPIKLEELEKRYEHLTSAQKADMLLQRRIVTEAQLKRWLASPLDIYDGAIRNRFQDNFLRAGVVFTDGELRDLFNLSNHQISLYREFRATVDKSLARLAIADMLRYGGKDIDDAMRARVMELDDSKKAGQMLSDRLMEIAEEDPERADVLMDSANTMLDKADRAKDLMEHGYAPLSRFGHYTLDVVDAEGKRVYFGMFESAREANQMAVKMRANFRGAKVTQGTVSEQAYKLFAGVSPETLELFGGMLGLESQGDDASSKAFQQYLKLAKANRSAMKRLIQRKGIAGFSEDVGRVLAGFVYSNARHTASTLHMGAISEAVNDIPQQQGEIKDMAINLSDYVKNPQEEAQAIRGLLFVQYLGGSLASAMVNMTQPFAVTMPYLSQFGGVASAAKQMAAAVKDAVKRKTGDAALDAALKTAEQEGIVAPQEVHHLMAQAQGRGALKSGDGTRLGDARAKVGNYYSKGLLLWGKPFALAEQFNRRATFIAAWRTAKEQGIKDPAKFAEQAIAETQFVYNKGNKPQWARGAVGGTLFTFKQYSISYLELLTRMAKSGPEGRKAALFMLAMMLLMGGAEGLPFADDADDVIDGALQRLGYNISAKQWKEEFLADVFGEAGGRFLRTGISGLPGAPIDVSGRLGMGNVIPGTGFLTKKTDYSRDILELAGPAGDFGKRVFQGANEVLAGNVVKAATTAAPKAFSNMAQAYDMQVTGMYRDQKGRKVIDTDGYDALAKAIGFQPNDVARVQDAAVQQQQMIAVNRMREAEIADKWAQAEFAKDREKVAEAKAELKEWNEKNPDAPIAIKYSQIFRRVREMNKSKADRIAGTAPKEIRASVKRDLKEAVQH